MKLYLSVNVLFIITIFYLKNGSVSAPKTHVPFHGFFSEKEFKLSPTDSLVFNARKFNSLNTQVRDNKITELIAKAEVDRMLSLIKRYYLNLKNSGSTNRKSFPVAGYNYRAIGGTNGSGYLPKGYNYYHGNKHKGHPAHDIFAHDKNQDCLDDKTGKPINILSVTEGVVIAAQPEWEPESELRGGKYLWIYNPKEERLYYYAHNQDLRVKVGEVVTTGQVIATMGRTGLNANKKRSPTHLHFMILKVMHNGSLSPVDSYPILSKLP